MKNINEVFVLFLFELCFVVGSFVAFYAAARCLLHLNYFCGCKRSNARETSPLTDSNNWVNHPPSLLKPIATMASSDCWICLSVRNGRKRERELVLQLESGRFDLQRNCSSSSELTNRFCWFRQCFPGGFFFFWNDWRRTGLGKR